MQAKEERNALVVKLYGEGKTNSEILIALEQAGYKDLNNPNSLTGLITRLKKSGKLPKERVRIRQQTGKTISRQMTKSQSKQIVKSTSKH